MDRVGSMLNNLKNRWQNLNRLVKIAIVLGVVSMLAIGGVVYYLETRIEYGVLFSDLSEADAGTVTEELEKNNIAYKLADDGTTIMIDKNKVDQERIDLAVNDELPSTSKGFDLFDSTSVMTTDEDRKILYQRALQGELQNAIQSLSAVKTAKVILVMSSSSSVFSDSSSSSSSKSKASITLTLKNGYISSQAVRGIVSLTTGAVSGLTANNVKVVDSDGNVLNSGSSSSTSSTSGTSSKYIQMQNKYDQQLQAKIKALLKSSMGNIGFTVSVNSTLDFDAVQNKTTTYSDPQVRSEETSAGGTAATVSSAETADEASNVATVTNDSSSSGASSASYSHTVNNELNTSVTKTIQAPGTVKRLTTSILVNDKLSKKNRRYIKKAVAAAIGYDSGRGDSIVVQGLSLKKATTKTKTTKKKATKKNSFPWLYVGIGIGALLLLSGITAFVIIRRRRQAEDEYYDDDYDVDVADDNIEASNEETAKDESVSTEPKIAPEVKKQLDRDTKAREYAQEHPEIAAELVKAWMKDDKDDSGR
ncbi:flagellar M-ring protein FliF [Ligilactobacillus sp. WILCCON 0076]|uniref:Flagellar M-ring protein n=1 Tax=Ligilactobacillus ubinensis TaxID=2876789 RepID=A0A9X2FHJ9_9LACO|nr:flagellar basal-body MS-ring/collar protein FliF [Ligilactobacillus ubinensis]MCP0886252.1 flagellar M-ring protein FliF [Ligilactobacillus ubinensis]